MPEREDQGDRAPGSHKQWDQAVIEEEARGVEGAHFTNDHPGGGRASLYQWAQIDEFPVELLEGTREEWQAWFEDEIRWAAEAGRAGYYEALQRWWTASSPRDLEHLIVVRGLDGKHYVWDGTHRQAISKINGMRVVPVFLGTRKPRIGPR